MREHPEFREAAYTAFAKAVRDGLLVRPGACARCGSVAPVDGHHADYLRPFDVVWLCRACHSAEHQGDTSFDRPRCLGCGGIIYRHVMRSGKTVRPYGPGFVHTRCARRVGALA